MLMLDREGMAPGIDCGFIVETQFHHTRLIMLSDRTVLSPNPNTVLYCAKYTLRKRIKSITAKDPIQFCAILIGLSVYTLNRP
jgi:hypothetical protein